MIVAAYALLDPEGVPVAPVEEGGHELHGPTVL